MGGASEGRRPGWAADLPPRGERGGGDRGRRRQAGGKLSGRVAELPGAALPARRPPAAVRLPHPNAAGCLRGVGQSNPLAVGLPPFPFPIPEGSRPAPQLPSAPSLHPHPAPAADSGAGEGTARHRPARVSCARLTDAEGR